MKIKLTPDQLVLCVMGANRIQAVKDATAVKRNLGTDPDRSKWVATLEGLFGEFALSLHLGIPYNFDAHIGGDGGNDFVYRDARIDLKTTRRVDGRLVLNLKDDKPEVDCDVLVLGIIYDFGTLDLVRCVSANKFLKNYLVKDLGYGDRAVMDQDEMSEFERFEEVVDYVSNLKKEAA